MDAIKGGTYLSLVSVWQEDVRSRRRSAFRTGFVSQHFSGKCAVITVREGLQMDKKLFVRFENGCTLEGSIYSGGQSSHSRLAAIIVCNLPFTPNIIEWSEVEAKQCDPVVHFGFFGNDCTMLGLSSGSVGLAGHSTPLRGKEKFTMFAHCCSQKQYTIGAPVCNLSGEGVGINISKRIDKNLFFAMDRHQVARETARLFGRDGMVRRLPLPFHALLP
jgi:hypothetical protein